MLFAMAHMYSCSVPEFVAVAASPTGRQVLLLLEDGAIIRVDPESGQQNVVGQIAVSSLERGKSPHNIGTAAISLQVSNSGRFAAASSDFAIGGATVVDLVTGRETMSLECPVYLPTTVPFSICFIDHGGRDAVVYRSEWNRLDIRDAQSGELLTPRKSPIPTEQARPDHLLDYFHGRLKPSPSGRKILDDGWVWQPYGVPYVIDTDRWLGGDVWESEDAFRRGKMSQRDEWDVGDCWIDDTRLALNAEKEIDDEGEERDFGARIVSTEKSASSILTIEGARGRLLSDGHRLFSVAEGRTRVWSVNDGKHLEDIDNFEAQFLLQDPAVLVSATSRELLVYQA